MLLVERTPRREAWTMCGKIPQYYSQPFRSQNLNWGKPIFSER